MNTDLTAYEQGLIAHGDGQMDHENPYEYGTEEYGEWHEGFRDAMADAQLERSHNRSLRYPAGV